MLIFALVIDALLIGAVMALTVDNAILRFRMGENEKDINYLLGKIKDPYPTDDKPIMPIVRVERKKWEVIKDDELDS